MSPFTLPLRSNENQRRYSFDGSQLRTTAGSASQELQQEAPEDHIRVLGCK